MVQISQEPLAPHMLARLSEALCVVTEGLEDVLLRFYSEAGEPFRQKIVDPDFGIGDPLGLGPLAALIVLSSEHVGQIHQNKIVRQHFDRLMRTLTTLYIFENITDDLCVVEFSGQTMHYRYADVMRTFYSVLEKLIEGHVSLSEAIAQVTALSTDHIRIPYIDRLVSLYPLPHKINTFFIQHFGSNTVISLRQTIYLIF